MKPKVVLLGDFQEGKSTLINCLLTSPDFPIVATIGRGVSTTKKAAIYCFGPQSSVQGKWESRQTAWEMTLEDFIQPGRILSACDYVRVELPHSLLKIVELVDCPGLDSTEPDDTKIANHEADLADFLVFVFRQSIPGHKPALRDFLNDKIVRQGKPYGIILNCGRNPDLKVWNSGASREVEQNILQALENAGWGKPKFCQRVNLEAYFQFTSCRHEAGNLDVFSALFQSGWKL